MVDDAPPPLALDIGGLTARQRTLVGDVLLAAEALAVLGPTDYQAQDDGLVVLRETWERLTQAMPGATTVFAAQDR